MCQHLTSAASARGSGRARSGEASEGARRARGDATGTPPPQVSSRMLLIVPVSLRHMLRAPLRPARRPSVANAAPEPRASSSAPSARKLRANGARAACEVRWIGTIVQSPTMRSTKPTHTHTQRRGGRCACIPNRARRFQRWPPARPSPHRPSSSRGRTRSRPWPPRGASASRGPAAGTAARPPSGRVSARTASLHGFRGPQHGPRGAL